MSSLSNSRNKYKTYHVDAYHPHICCSIIECLSCTTVYEAICCMYFRFVLVFFSILLVLRLPRLGKRELILVLSVRLFGCACLDLSVSSSSWGLGRAAVCDCGTPWTFLLPFLRYTLRKHAYSLPDHIRNKFGAFYRTDNILFSRIYIASQCQKYSSLNNNELQTDVSIFLDSDYFKLL